MEKRKQFYTPRNGIDDSLLLEILGNNNTGYSSCCENQAKNSSCHTPNFVSRENTEGICRRHYGNWNTGRHSHRAEANEHQSNSCGCRASGNAVRREEAPDRDECTCGEKCIMDSCINSYAPAMVYCPDHEFDGLYSCEEALDRGTLFNALDLVFYPTRCNNCK